MNAGAFKGLTLIVLSETVNEVGKQYDIRMKTVCVKVFVTWISLIF
jgi:hypothetical protein